MIYFYPYFLIYFYPIILQNYQLFILKHISEQDKCLSDDLLPGWRPVKAEISIFCLKEYFSSTFERNDPGDSYKILGL